MDDARDFITFAWKTFTTKLSALIAIISFTLIAISLRFSEEIPGPAKVLLVFGSTIAIVFLITYTIVLGISGLLKERKELISAAQQAWAHAKDQEAQKQSLLDKVDSHRESWARNSDIYGLIMYKVYVTVKVTPDGGLESKHELEFTATHPGINSIEQVTTVVAPENMLEDLIQLQAEGSMVDGIKLEPEVTRRNRNSLLWQIRATPSLPVGKRLNFSYSNNWPKGTMAMTHEELTKRGERWEYYYLRCTFPTEELKLVVYLPNNFRPHRNEFDVWFAPGAQVKHQKECHRILDAKQKLFNPCWENDSFKLELTVPYPIQGLTYALKWFPPVVWEPL